MQLGVAGYGVVGRALVRFFSRSGAHTVRIYDKYVEPYNDVQGLRALDDCEIVFLAVPTPYDIKRGQCDITALRELVDKLGVPACIKSTVPPGTTQALMRATGRALAFSPEYLGESTTHPWPEIDDCGFAVAGGHPAAVALVRHAYETASTKPLRFIETDATTAELAKYMDNAFLATKIAFVNQFYDLARHAGVDYAELRKLFVLDPRVGESHTEVTPQRGFGGKCLPKDLHSILAWAQEGGGAPLLQSLAAYNDSLRDNAVDAGSPDHQPM